MTRRADSHDLIRVQGARVNNLQDVDVDIGVLVVVTGVAGSGKSSLIHGLASTGEQLAAFVSSRPKAVPSR
jgi:excinuclease UvrABC ATPase subunit